MTFLKLIVVFIFFYSDFYYACKMNYCKTCSSTLIGDICKECEKGFYRFIFKCYACPKGCVDCDAFDCFNCKIGYYKSKKLLEGFSCFSCESNCKTCTSSSKCTSCKENYELINGDCVNSIFLLCVYIISGVIVGYIIIKYMIKNYIKKKINSVNMNRNNVVDNNRMSTVNERTEIPILTLEIDQNKSNRLSNIDHHSSEENLQQITLQDDPKKNESKNL